MGRSLLLLVSGFLIIFGIIQQSTQNRQHILEERAPEYFYQEQSRNIAGGMLEISLGNLNNGLNYLTPNSIDNVNIEMLNGIGQIKIDSTSNFNSRLFVTISGEIERPDSTKAITTINAVLDRDPFSIYAYFTDVEPEIWFGSDDVLNGPVHTNDQFHMKGTPEFNGPVTSPNGYKKYPYGSTNPEFNGGANFSSNEVELPKEAPDVVNLADQGGLKFNNEIEVKFEKDGQVQITEKQQTGSSWKCVSRYRDYCLDWDRVPDYETISTGNYIMEDFNGVISSSENVEVEGILNGQVTLHSEKDVTITGDVVYENRNYNDPDKGPISDDRLGIVSEGDTIVDREAHRHDNGNGISDKNEDLFIDASILTLGDSFRVEGYNEYGYRGDLNILGGLIQRERGPVGTFGGSYGTTGYSKNYTYDTRFLENSTPGFPRKKQFEIENWRETTSVKPLNE